jgi:hypothetical protein
MKTRSNKNKTSATAPNNSASCPAIEYDQRCAICLDIVDPAKIKTIHEDPGGKWKHWACLPCANEWASQCRKSNKSPSCPLCPSIAYDTSKYEKTANGYFRLVELPTYLQKYVVILVKHNGETIHVLSNEDLLFSHEVLHGASGRFEKNPMPIYSNDLYSHRFDIEGIRCKIREIGKQIFVENGCRGWTPPNKTWSDTFTNMLYTLYPKIEIEDVRFISPPGLDHEIVLEDIDEYDTTLKEMYIKYFTEIERLKDSKDTDPDLVAHLTEYTTTKNLEWVEGETRFDSMSWYDYQEPGHWEKGIPAPIIEKVHLRSQIHPYMFIEVNVQFVDDTA